MATKGTAGVRSSLADAERELARVSKDDDPLPHLPRDGIEPGRWPGYPTERLPPGCSVVPVGIQDKTTYFIDSVGQLVEVKFNEWGHKLLWQIFSSQPNFPTWAWPRFGKEGKINGTESNQASACLIAAASAQGVFDPAEKVRGRGAWCDRDGSILYHAGHRLWRAGGKHSPVGRVAGRIYPTRPAIAEPWTEAVGDADNPAREILLALRRWNWTRPAVDPVLLLGWMAAAMLGGALPWRPTVFVTGDKAVGKSTLQHLLKAALGDQLLQTADTTAAGLYQRIGQDALPIAVDELESDADNRRVMAVIKLARIAASGDMMFRGGADHTGTEFRAQSAFFFSSINPPPLAPQDLSRLALLRLRPVEDHGSSPPVIDSEKTPRLLLRRLLDEWHRFGETFQAYRTELRRAGHGGRGQDTYGVLLACADLALGPSLADELGVPMSDDLSWWAQALAVTELQEHEDATENWLGCARHLLTSRVEVWRSGTRHTVGGILEDLLGKNISEEEANKQLAQTGMRAIAAADVAGKWLLAVPNQSQLVAELFRGTVWAGAPGAAVWASALRQGPANAVLVDKARNRVRINGVQTRCTLLVCESVMEA
jgi:hypothetical protein